MQAAPIIVAPAIIDGEWCSIAIALADFWLLLISSFLGASCVLADMRSRTNAVRDHPQRVT